MSEDSTHNKGHWSEQEKKTFINAIRENGLYKILYEIVVNKSGFPIPKLNRTKEQIRTHLQKVCIKMMSMEEKKSYHDSIDVINVHDIFLFTFEGKEGLIKLGKRKRDNEKAHTPPHRSFKERMYELNIEDCRVIHAMLSISMKFIDFKHT